MRRVWTFGILALALMTALCPAALAAEPAADFQVCYPTSITRSEDGTELKKIRKAQSLSEYRAAVRNLLRMLG